MEHRQRPGGEPLDRHGAPTGGLPPGLHLARTTDVFDATTVPPGLLRAHRLADGVWGRVVVHAGRVRLVFEAGDSGTGGDLLGVWLDAGATALIPPSRPHHVELAEGARFAVEFHRP